VKNIGVLVVDDSAVVRQVLTQMLSAEPGIEVIGSAADPVLAVERMKQRWPDVFVLDVEMPRMDGISFLRKIMSERPTPVVICSTLTTAGAQTTLDALAAGAVAIVAKPKLQLREKLKESSDDLVSAIRAAAQSNVKRLTARRPNGGGEAAPPAAAIVDTGKQNADVILKAAVRPMAETTENIVAIGTSTGGTQALEEVLTKLPRVCPAIVIVQHMPEAFTAAFASRLNNLCQIEVREARSGERLMPGLALIAPGGKHLLVRRSGAQYITEVRDGPAVNRHRPSVDVLFRSVAGCAGANAVGIILTGMGDDGARGLKEMRGMGARTFAQDQDTCVVFGMPKEAIRLDAVDRIVPLTEVPRVIMGVRHVTG
jgi:two-component system, chemotaxis family, protein-glutamate methylesterase/glutaminase